MIDCHWIGCKPCGSCSSQIKICSTLAETSASLAAAGHAPRRWIFYYYFFFFRQQAQTDYCFSWLDHQTDDAFPICSSGDNITIFSVWVATWIMKSMIWPCFIFNAHQTWNVCTERISFLNRETGSCSFYVPFILAILLFKSVCGFRRAMSGLFSEGGQLQNERVWLLVADWRSVW